MSTNLTHPPSAGSVAADDDVFVSEIAWVEFHAAVAPRHESPRWLPARVE
jgi:hypothetical protein